MRNWGKQVAVGLKQRDPHTYYVAFINFAQKITNKKQQANFKKTVMSRPAYYLEGV